MNSGSVDSDRIAGTDGPSASASGPDFLIAIVAGLSGESVTVPRVIHFGLAFGPSAVGLRVIAWPSRSPILKDQLGRAEVQALIVYTSARGTAKPLASSGRSLAVKIIEAAAGGSSAFAIEAASRQSVGTRQRNAVSLVMGRGLRWVSVCRASLGWSESANPLPQGAPGGREVRPPSPFSPWRDVAF